MSSCFFFAFQPVLLSNLSPCLINDIPPLTCWRQFILKSCSCDFINSISFHEILFSLSLVSFFHIQALTLIWQFFCVGDSCSFPTDFAYSLVSPSRTVKTYHMVRMGSHCGKLTATTSHPPPSFYGLSHFLIHRSFFFLILSAAVHISISLLFLWTGL